MAILISKLWDMVVEFLQVSSIVHPLQHLPNKINTNLLVEFIMSQWKFNGFTNFLFLSVQTTNNSVMDQLITAINGQHHCKHYTLCCKSQLHIVNFYNLLKWDFWSNFSTLWWNWFKISRSNWNEEKGGLCKDSNWPNEPLVPTILPQYWGVFSPQGWFMKRQLSNS